MQVPFPTRLKIPDLKLEPAAHDKSHLLDRWRKRPDGQVEHHMSFNTFLHTFNIGIDPASVSHHDLITKIDDLATLTEARLCSRAQSVLLRAEFDKRLVEKDLQLVEDPKYAHTKRKVKKLPEGWSLPTLQSLMNETSQEQFLNYLWWSYRRTYVSNKAHKKAKAKKKK